MASSKRPTILRKLRIGELSLVDRPANPGAEVLLWKRDGEPPAAPALAEYQAAFDHAAAAYRDLLAKGAGADAFDAALGAREAMEAVQAFNSAVWEVLDALGSAVCRISEDDAVTDKGAAIQEAVQTAMARLPAEVAEEAAEGDDVGKADAAAAKPADGRAAMGPAKRKLGAHLADLRDKLKGAKHAGHVAQALGGFYRHTAGVLASMPPSASPTDPPADGGVAKGAASPAALSIPAAGDGATARDGMTERQTGGAADTGTADAAELRKRLDEQATELAELKKRAGEADELRKRLEDTEAIAKAEREMRVEAEFTKRAEAELPNLKGHSVVKGRMLRAIVERTQSADEAVKKQAEEELATLKAADAATAAAFKAVGMSGRPAAAGDARAELDQRVAKVQRDDPKLTKADASRMVMKSDPAFAQRYDEEVRANGH